MATVEHVRRSMKAARGPRIVYASAVLAGRLEEVQQFALAPTTYRMHPVACKLVGLCDFGFDVVTYDGRRLYITFEDALSKEVAVYTLVSYVADRYASILGRRDSLLVFGKEEDNGS